MKTTKFILTIALLSLVAIGTITAVRAEEPTDSTADQAIQGDTQDLIAQEISAEDLGVKDQKFLPDNPFYFLKEWTRNVRMAFTFNEIKKTELENRFTNERLIELKKLTENGVSSEKIKKATENYQNAIDKIKERADKIKEKAADSEAVNKFLEKFTNQQVLQEKILQKLETQVPEAAFEKIKEARNQHMEKFGEVMQKLEDRQDKIKEKIENTLQNGDASNTEILDKIKEKMPDDMKERLESMRGNMMEKVNNKMMERAIEK
ncbi:MAG: DUF5667 domain-containing protein, partial [bacterium]|nr:DUF5667 domain-containing protein [bacterium]